MGGDIDYDELDQAVSDTLKQSRPAVNSPNSMAAKRRRFMDFKPAGHSARPLSSHQPRPVTPPTSQAAPQRTMMDVKPARNVVTPPVPVQPDVEPVAPQVSRTAPTIEPLSNSTPDLDESNGRVVTPPPLSYDESADQPQLPEVEQSSATEQDSYEPRDAPTPDEPEESPRDSLMFEHDHEEFADHSTHEPQSSPESDASHEEHPGTDVSFLDREDTGEPTGVTTVSPDEALSHDELAEVYPQLAAKMSGDNDSQPESSVLGDKTYVHESPSRMNEPIEDTGGMVMPEMGARTTEVRDKPELRDRPRYATTSTIEPLDSQGEQPDHSAEIERLLRGEEPETPVEQSEPATQSEVVEQSEPADQQPEPETPNEPQTFDQPDESQPVDHPAESSQTEQAIDQSEQSHESHDESHSDEEDADLDSFVTSYQETRSPLTSPFLPDAKVEKRPLGQAPLTQQELTQEDLLGDEQPVDEVDEQPVDAQASESADEPAVQPTDEPAAQPTDESSSAQPAETQGNPPAPESQSDTSPRVIDVANGPADDNHAVLRDNIVMDMDDSLPATHRDTMPFRPTLTGSIPQQYTTRPSSGDAASGAIYDTSQYHQPLAPHHQRVAFWVIWVVAIIILGALAGAAYYYTTHG